MWGGLKTSPVLIMSICAKCKKEASRLVLVDPAEGWLCSDCRFTAGSWTKREKIQSRVRMPDGTILQGHQGIKILNERQRNQERGERMRIK